MLTQSVGSSFLLQMLAAHVGSKCWQVVTPNIGWIDFPAIPGTELLAARILGADSGPWEHSPQILN